MKKQTKVLLTLLCAVLLVVGSVMGTLAYLTSQDSVTNTFTVGEVKIELDEARVNEMGQPVDAEGNPVDDVKNAPRVEKNEYHLLPGHEYTKDPTVTVKTISDESYVRMIVTVNDYNNLIKAFPKNKEFGAKKEKVYAEWYKDFGNGEVFLLENVIDGWDETKWECVAIDATKGTYEFRYHTTVAAPTADVKLEPLFTEIQIPGYVNNDELKFLDKLEINVVAHAIQKDGFATADEAWDAFDLQKAAEAITP